MKTIIVSMIILFIIIRVFYQIYKDYKKNKNLCVKDCGCCNSSCHAKSRTTNKKNDKK